MIMAHAAGSAAGSERSGAGRPRGRGHGSYATAAVLQEQLASREDEIKSLRRQLESERATLARRTEQLLEPASPTQRDAVREESLAVAPRTTQRKRASFIREHRTYEMTSVIADADPVTMHHQIARNNFRNHVFEAERHGKLFSNESFLSRDRF